MEPAKEALFVIVRIPKNLAATIVSALRPFGEARDVPSHLQTVKRCGNQCDILLYRLSTKNNFDALLSTIKALSGEAEFTEKQLPLLPPSFREQQQWPVNIMSPRLENLIDSTELVNVLKDLKNKYHDKGLDACVVYDHETGNVLAEATANSAEPWPLRHSVIIAINSYSQIVSQELSEKYLLSSASIVCLYEPCLMCSMALVHSRVRGLLFSFPIHTHRGGFNSKENLLSLRVNHKFPVFREEDDNIYQI